MKKIQFALQVITLAVAFPVWFIAEMKHGSKAMQNSHINNADSANVKESTAQAISNIHPAKTVTMPDTVQLLVNN